MKNLITAALFASSALALPASAKEVDPYLQQKIEADGIAGLSVVVVQDGRIERIKGYGYANLEHQVPVHSDTLFKPGAVGMQWTASAILMLVEDGKLTLNDSVRHHLPSLPKSWHPVTIQQLLNHMSGLPATPNADFLAEYSDDEMLTILSAQDLNFAAGTRWRFSYTNYILLGFIIKKVTGQSFAEFLKDRLFTTQAMHSVQPISDKAIIQHRAAGYEWRNNKLQNAEFISAFANSTADGSLYFSPLDFAAWVVALDQGRIFKPQTMAEMAKPLTLKNGCAIPYSYGWFERNQQGRQLQWHNGSWQGFQSYVVRDPAKKLTVALFANSENADASDMAKQIAAKIDPSVAAPAAQPLAHGEPAVDAKVAQLLKDMRDKRVRFADFTDYAKLDFDEMMALNHGLMQAMGKELTVAPFAQSKNCGEAQYVYRARDDQQIIELRMTLAANGRIADLDIVPIPSWNAPL